MYNILQVVIKSGGEFQITQRKHKLEKFERHTTPKEPPPKIMFTLHFSSLSHAIFKPMFCIKVVVFKTLHLIRRTPLLLIDV